MAYVEEKEFSLKLVLQCAFPDDYDGDEDGYEWAREFPTMAQEIVQAAIRSLSVHPSWKLRPGNRGRSSEDEVVLIAERTLK